MCARGLKDEGRKRKHEASSSRDRDEAYQEKTGCNEHIQLTETATGRKDRENTSSGISCPISHRQETRPKLKIKFNFASSSKDNTSSKNERKCEELFETNVRHFYGDETQADKRKKRKRIIIPLRNRLLKNLTIKRGWKEKITCCPKYCWAECRTLPVEKRCILRYQLQNAVLTQLVGHSLETHRGGKI